MKAFTKWRHWRHPKYCFEHLKFDKNVLPQEWHDIYCSKCGNYIGSFMVYCGQVILTLGFSYRHYRPSLVAKLQEEVRCVVEDEDGV